MTDTDIATILNAIGVLNDKFDAVNMEIAVIKTDIGDIKVGMESMNEDIHNIAVQQTENKALMTNILNGLNGQFPPE